MVDGDHACDGVVDVDDKKAKGKSPHPCFINSTCLSVRHKVDSESIESYRQLNWNSIVLKLDEANDQKIK